MCDDWLYLSKFKSWMETQEWEGKQIDKDILSPGNKVYGPDVCVFVSREVNTFVTDSSKSRGTFPIGVYFEKDTGKYKSQCWSVEGKRKNLGRFETPEEAHAAWLNFKLEQAHILSSRQDDARVAKALINRYENYVEIEGILR